MRSRPNWEPVVGVAEEFDTRTRSSTSMGDSVIRRASAVLVAVLLSIGAPQASAQETPLDSRLAGDMIIPLARVFARPDDFDEREIRVIGVLAEDPALALFLTREDFENDVFSNALAIIGPVGLPLVGIAAGDLVLVEGVFHAYTGEIVSIYSGKISGVSEVKKWAVRGE